MKRFSLRSLVVLLTVAAVCFAIWNQSRQSAEIRRLTRQLASLKAENRIASRIAQLLVHLDDEDTATRALLHSLVPTPPDPTLELEIQALVRAFQVAAKISDVDGSPGGLEVLTLCSPFVTIPGTSASVSVLFDGDSVVDIVTRSTGTRRESHTTHLTDADGDGRTDLVIHCTPGFLSSSSAQKIVYRATKTGFVPPELNDGITMR